MIFTSGHGEILHVLRLRWLELARVNCRNGPKRASAGGRALLEFGPTDPLVGYVDSHAGNLYLERDRQTGALGHAFDRLRAGALDPEDSAALLARHAAKEN